MKAAASLAAAAALSLLAYLKGPALFWRLWFRLFKGRRVTLGSARKKPMLLSEEVWAVILAVIVVASVFAASQALLSKRVVEPFSELGVLGPTKKIGDYPKLVVAGENITLYCYVGNHMGKPMYYAVYVKVGSRETPVDPAPLDPVLKLYTVLEHNTSTLIPVTITLKTPGVNRRIIFELWALNETTMSFQYHERWCQIWVNVTAPA